MAKKNKKTFVESQPEGSLKGTIFDYIPDAFQMSNYLKQFLSDDEQKGKISKSKGKGKPRAFKNGGAVMNGRGPKFKGQT
jgi:trehalose-6-phosphatase